MKKNGIIILIGLMFSMLLGPLLSASEAVPQKSAGFRQATLEALVAESQREKTFFRRADGQYSTRRSDYFTSGKEDPLVLEPADVSVGNVVGA